jgi:hypothetical protein
VITRGQDPQRERRSDRPSPCGPCRSTGSC